MDSTISSEESDDNNYSKLSIKNTSFDFKSQNSDSTKRKKRDPNEPQKPVSAYALFFRDTQTAIKGQNPDASFGDVSRIVASMWDALDAEHKNVYKSKAENAKKEYLKDLADYRANALSRDDNGNNSSANENNHGAAMRSPQQHLPNYQKVAQSPVNSVNNLPSGNVSMQRVGANNLVSVQNCAVKSESQTEGATTNRQQISQNQGVDNNDQNMQNSSPGNQNSLPGGQKCIRTGCPNEAVVNPDWEDGYCSNECVVSHCRHVFTEWVKTNISPQESY